MHNRVKGIFLTGILTSSILLLLLIPFGENEADATRDDKPPGISIFFVVTIKIKKH